MRGAITMYEGSSIFIVPKVESIINIQDDFESCADILITTYWLHVELGKNV
jgi:hypothetical protein